jgi:hypothetical protein
VTEFERAFNRKPDHWGALSYDAAMLIGRPRKRSVQTAVRFGIGLRPWAAASLRMRARRARFDSTTRATQSTKSHWSRRCRDERASDQMDDSAAGCSLDSAARSPCLSPPRSPSCR